MLVSDIYDDAKEALGFANQTKIFGRITDAIETLANKGSWEPLLVYVSIPVTNSQYVYLPDNVEVPIRVALDNNPAFSRGRMYEFTMNGPGPYDERVDWSWEDLASNNIILADDQGNTTGTDESTRRLIKISRAGGVAVRMLARLRTSAVTSLDDWIPLHSKLAIILMLKALESYRRGSPQDFQLGQGQEAQALKFLQEEQQSRNTPQDLAGVMDKAPIIGYTYHSNNMVVVADIYDEAAEISGPIGTQHVLDNISEAVECLANKGQWDGMTGYLTMAPSSDLIGLPRQVEIPIRINIENRPSLSRSRMFEFTVNGPGTDLSELTTLTWEDQGNGPLMLPLTTPSVIGISGTEADAGKTVTLQGIDKDDVEVTHVYTIPNTRNESSAPIIWKTVYSITKDVTVSPVQVQANFVTIAVLYPDETAPLFRQIKLSKVADEIKIMFRKSSLKISSTDDIIPLKSRSAILNMMRSLQLYKAPDLNQEKIAMAQALEQNALKYLQEEEQSRLAYIQASLKDIMPALGRNYNSRGVLTAGDVFDDAADIFGPIGRQRLFDKITEGMEILANKSIWDGLDGYVDILSDKRGYISLPRKIEVPAAMNFCNTPTQMQSRWYEFHMNGMGGCGVPCDGWIDVGEYPLIAEPPSPVRLYSITSFQSDADRVLRAYGYDHLGNWIRSVEDGVYVDGELIPVSVRQNQDNVTTIPVTSHYFSQITRVSKDASDMQMELWGGTTQYQDTDFTSPPLPADRPAPEPGPDPAPPPLPPPDPPPPVPLPPAVPTFLAYYEAEETEPLFRRIKVPCWVTWVRMRYRMSTFKITKMSDVINLRSKTALVTMLRGLKALEAGDLGAYGGFEKAAVTLISEEQSSRNPAETFQLQFDQKTCFADPLQNHHF